MNISKAKMSALRNFFISVDESVLAEWMKKNDLETSTLKELSEHLISNGDCGLNADCTPFLINGFIDFVDKYTTMTRDKIKEIVDNDDSDYLMTPWEDIFNKSFNAHDLNASVVYVVEIETDGRKWEHNTHFELFSNYDTAMDSFDETKETAIMNMDGLSDEWVVEKDKPNHWIGQDNEFESYIDIELYKKVIY